MSPIRQSVRCGRCSWITRTIRKSWAEPTANRGATRTTRNPPISAEGWWEVCSLSGTSQTRRRARAVLSTYFLFPRRGVRCAASLRQLDSLRSGEVSGGRVWASC
jgi:hypothetical protein